MQWEVHQFKPWDRPRTYLPTRLGCVVYSPLESNRAIHFENHSTTVCVVAELWQIGHNDAWITARQSESFSLSHSLLTTQTLQCPARARGGYERLSPPGPWQWTRPLWPSFGDVTRARFVPHSCGREGSQWDSPGEQQNFSRFCVRRWRWWWWCGGGGAFLSHRLHFYFEIFDNWEFWECPWMPTMPWIHNSRVLVKIQ